MATLDTEIRKLRPLEFYSLAKILSPDFWKILMGNIKKPESQDPMFTSEHITLIENAATKQPRTASEIFLDEWGTMGRKRPTIKMAIDLLVEAEIFRAADFLAVEVLKGSPPDRPSKGPAAQIKIPDDIFNYGNQQDNPFDTNSNIEYNSTAILDDHNVDDTVCSDNYRTTLPLYLNNNSRVIEGQFSDSNIFNQPNIIANELSDSGSSDLIKFCSDDDESKKNEMDRNNILNESNLDVANDVNNWNEQSTSYLPNLSILKLDSPKHETVDEVINFPTELASSELPLCVNNRITVSSYQESYSSSEYSVTSSMSSDLRYTTSDNNVENNYGVTADVIKPNNLENEQKFSDNIQHNVDHSHLPLTVIEFYKQ
ncbi:hypothetical protein PV327_001700 [Microctonus hyperodae]|uniref:Tube Death domain-containing protein n=1 Tax=Microctonus hyperodae TaxID=165561 RepID=A0AA39KNA9_MICHY|nr:hypothetical protein PV327_001700 [Microctonus hyperodae]